MAGPFFRMGMRRGPSDPWFRLGTFDVTTSAIVAGLFLFSLLIFGVRASALPHLYFSTEEVTRGQLWRLVTWPLVVGTDPSVWDVLTAGMFWYFGGQVENELGRRRYLVFLGLLTIVPALATLPFVFGWGGLQYLELWVLVGWALGNRHVRFFGMIPAPALAIVFVVVEMLRFSGHQVLGGVVFVFVGAVLSPILLRSFGMLSDLPQIPAVPLLAKLVSPSRRTGKARTTGPRRAPGNGMGSKRPVDGPPRTSRPSTARTKAKGSDPSTVVQGPWDAKPVDQRELDRLLDKIAAQGIDSLSADERKMLDEASRRLRERRDS